MKYTVEDLGIAGFGQAHIDWEVAIMARHPRTGAELAIQPTFQSGFLVIDPRERCGFHVTPEPLLQVRAGRIVAQASHSPIYQTSDPYEPPPDGTAGWLLAWDWTGRHSRKVASLPKAFRGVDVAPDGRVYLNGAGVYRYDPRSGGVEPFDPSCDTVHCAADGFIYANQDRKIWSLDPATAARTQVLLADGSSCPLAAIRKDGGGRLILPIEVSRRQGRIYWLELLAGAAVPVDAATVRLAHTLVSNERSAVMNPDARYMQSLPLVFRDGSYISRFDLNTVTHVDPDGLAHQFTVPWQEHPMRLFTSTGGGGRIWMASILPLMVFSYDPDTGRFSRGFNPTPVVGEVYTMVWSKGGLYMASYPGAFLTRYDPRRPWRMDESPMANPRQLGQMKDGPLALHRPMGKTIDPQGNIYFAAVGDYGCPDSGVCRIDADTEEVTRWIYPDTRCGAICHIPAAGQLILAEQRLNEEGVRFTLLNDQTGKAVWSELILRGNGTIDAWLCGEGDLIYGIYDQTATIFAFNHRTGELLARRDELAVGHHGWNSLWFGPDQRIWGLTRSAVFAISRDFQHLETLATYPTFPNVNGYGVFGVAFDERGDLYFPNEEHLMRMRIG